MTQVSTAFKVVGGIGASFKLVIGGCSRFKDKKTLIVLGQRTDGGGSIGRYDMQIPENKFFYAQIR